jgi:alkylhydroperoxidase family enzyme
MARAPRRSTFLHTVSASRGCRVGNASLMDSRAAPTAHASRRRAEVLGARPELAAAHQRLVDTIWEGRVSPVTLELCRLRMAMLLDSAAALAERTDAATAAGLTEDRIGRLAQWPTDASFSEEERTCIAFVESFLIGHDQISDDDVQGLTDALTAEGVVTFTTALVVWDNQHRLDNALHVGAGQG